jgi:poly(3-hydroxybutyrate) depolymerase
MPHRLATVLIFAQAALASPVRYLDPVFANVATASDIRYGSNLDHTGARVDLLMDVYQPAGDTARARPLLIWIHGGGFSAGTKTDGDVVGLCRIFAMKGYVTASIAYRLESPLNTSAAMAVEVLRAVQDAKAAVRYLRAHRAEYRIDDTRILMGGTSAGGVLSLDYAYLDQDEIPRGVDTNAVGGIEGNSGTPGVSSAINGIVNCWGGVGDSAILYDAKLPAIHFHGTADPTVPFDVGYALGNPALTTCGSACVHRVLTRVGGVRSVLKPFVGMGHGIPAGDKRADTLIAMTTVFAYQVLFPDAAALAPRSPRGPGLGPARSGPFRRADGRRRRGPAASMPFFGRKP